MKPASPTLPAAVLALVIAGCSPAPPPAPPQEPPAPAAQAPAALAEPTVVMEANPAPPFTYWAPEGATIRNHPTSPGIWQAFVDGKNVATYFGDECAASKYQDFVGKSVDAPPAMPPGVDLRTSCETCPVNSDLRANRMNVIFNEGSRTITKIACY